MNGLWFFRKGFSLFVCEQKFIFWTFLCTKSFESDLFYLSPQWFSLNVEIMISANCVTYGAAFLTLMKPYSRQWAKKKKNPLL